MIKRVKWNMLYDGDGIKDNRDDDSSDDESDGAAEMLEKLIRSDPDLARLYERRDENDDEEDDEADDEEDDEADDEEVLGNNAMVSPRTLSRNHEDQQEKERGSPTGPKREQLGRRRDNTIEAEGESDVLLKSSSELEAQPRKKEKKGVQTCELCPGKIFLNEFDVDTHLQSKLHKKALRKLKQGQMSSEEIERRKAKNARKRERRAKRKSESAV